MHGRRAQTLDEQLLGSGRVTFFGSHEYVGTEGSGHRLLSRVTGEETAVRARNVVDGTYLDTQLPSRHVPGFEVEPGARVVTPGELVDLAEPADGFTVLGAGKTAMDTCTWLLDQGVTATDIRWVRPRDAWLLDRACTQPLEMVGETLQDTAAALQAGAEAEDLDDLYARAEACGHLYRLSDRVVVMVMVMVEPEEVRLINRSWMDRDGDGALPDALTATFNDQTFDTDARAAYLDSGAWQALLEVVADVDALVIADQTVVVVCSGPLTVERVEVMVPAVSDFVERVLLAQSRGNAPGSVRLSDPLPAA